MKPPREVQYCPGCQHPLPAVRANHGLEYETTEELAAHLEAHIALEDDRLSILRHYRDTRTNWDGFAHPATGARMHWREARQWALRDARRRKAARLQELATKRDAQGPQEPLRIATDIARIVEALPWSPDRWAQGHLVMMQRGLGAPGRAREALAFCAAMAEVSPRDAADWLDEAAQYRHALPSTAEEGPHGDRTA